MSMVGTPKAAKEQSGSISEVWKSMSLEDTIAEPGESSTVSWNVVWCGMVWYGMVWYGMVWYGMEW